MKQMADFNRWYEVGNPVSFIWDTGIDFSLQACVNSKSARYDREWFEWEKVNKLDFLA